MFRLDFHHSRVGEGPQGSSSLDRATLLQYLRLQFSQPGIPFLSYLQRNVPERALDALAGIRAVPSLCPDKHHVGARYRWSGYSLVLECRGACPDFARDNPLTPIQVAAESSAGMPGLL